MSKGHEDDFIRSCSGDLSADSGLSIDESIITPFINSITVAALPADSHRTSSI